MARCVGDRLLLERGVSGSVRAPDDAPAGGRRLGEPAIACTSTVSASSARFFFAFGRDFGKDMNAGAGEPYRTCDGVTVVGTGGMPTALRIEPPDAVRWRISIAMPPDPCFTSGDESTNVGLVFSGVTAKKSTSAVARAVVSTVSPGASVADKLVSSASSSGWMKAVPDMGGKGVDGNDLLSTAPSA